MEERWDIVVMPFLPVSGYFMLANQQFSVKGRGNLMEVPMPFGLKYT